MGIGVALELNDEGKDVLAVIRTEKMRSVREARRDSPTDSSGRNLSESKSSRPAISAGRIPRRVRTRIPRPSMTPLNKLSWKILFPFFLMVFMRGLGRSRKTDHPFAGKTGCQRKGRWRGRPGLLPRSGYPAALDLCPAERIVKKEEDCDPELPRREKERFLFRHPG